MRTHSNTERHRRELCHRFHERLDHRWLRAVDGHRQGGQFGVGDHLGGVDDLRDLVGAEDSGSEGVAGQAGADGLGK